MLTAYPRSSEHNPDAAVWFDLLNPTEDELGQVEKSTGLSLPRAGALGEIERSSRLQRQGGALIMSTPTAVQASAGSAAMAPLGFMLTGDRLVTIRFTELVVFDTVRAQLPADQAIGGIEIFTRLCEDIVDHMADALEHLAAELGKLSQATFRQDDAKSDHGVRANLKSKAQLRQVGRLGHRLSALRDGALGLERILAFAEQFGCHDTAIEIKARLTSVRQDLKSLADYNDQLTNKVQFVLDALVGLIGIAQNDIFKVLTIVSIVGIAPTLIAGIYGMNFKNMPEYNWTYGYPYGLAVIALSGILPLIWFKFKGWF
ncbi:magnesium transporter CorA family protein [Novosphingobium sp.]|uniref:magnesium transporter CorA family protein n=1 Tax=Novosphingobium sp. TaxID=1874826 RepID=UPI003D13F0DF